MVIVMAEGEGASSEHNGQYVGTAGVTSVSESGVGIIDCQWRVAPGCPGGGGEACQQQLTCSSRYNVSREGERDVKTLVCQQRVMCPDSTGASHSLIDIYHSISRIVSS